MYRVLPAPKRRSAAAVETTQLPAPIMLPAFWSCTGKGCGECAFQMPPSNTRFTFSSSGFHLKELQGHTGVQQQLRPPGAGAQMCSHGIRAQRLRGLGENIEHPQLAGSKENLGRMKRRDSKGCLRSRQHSARSPVPDEDKVPEGLVLVVDPMSRDDSIWCRDWSPGRGRATICGELSP